MQKMHHKFHFFFGTFGVYILTHREQNQEQTEKKYTQNLKLQFITITVQKTKLIKIYIIKSIREPSLEWFQLRGVLQPIPLP